MTDILKDLGAFAFASRLKRLSDRLKAEVLQIYQEQGIDFNDSWFLVGYMLSRHESMTVTDMALALCISPPAISQISADMVKGDIINIETGETDRRQRILSLTPKGKKMVRALEPLWDAVTKCTEELFDEAGCNILEAITALEKELDKKDMIARLREEIGRK